MKKLCFFACTIFFNLLVQAEGVTIVDKRATCSTNFTLCEICNKERLLFPLNQFSNNSDSLEILADSSEVLENNEYLISGNVTVKSNSNFLAADQVTISKEKNTSSAVGSVNYQDKNFLLLGDKLTVEKKNEDMFIEVENASYQEIKSKANGKAKEVFKNNDMVILKNSTYTFCPIGNNDWQINAKQINLDLTNNRALANNASLEFFGVPIIYLPKYSWVTSGRGSGFLSPSFNIYKENSLDSSDFYYRTPYYFNIAPDRDLLIALSYLSSRGDTYEGKYRQLIPNRTKDNGLFEIEGHFLFGDKITNKNRWLLESSIGLELNKNTHLNFSYNRVSDSDYFKDILRRRTDEVRLNSHFKIEHNIPALPKEKDSEKKSEKYKNSEKLDTKKILTVNYGRNRIGVGPGLRQTSFSVYSEQEQTVNHGLPNYTKNLEAAFFIKNPAKPISPYSLDFGLMATDFNHVTADKDTGIRTHGEINLLNNINVPGPLSASSTSTINLTNYILNQNNNESRVSGSFKLDISLPSSKETSLFNNSLIHKLEPKISYFYTPKQKQSKLPIFDTTDNYLETLTYTSLSGKRYNGVDRINHENDLMLSFKSSYLDSIEPNESRLNFVISQRYYGDDEAVSDSPNEDFEKIRRYSDITSSLDISLGKYHNLKASIKAQYDPEKSKVSKNEIGFSYTPHSRKFISMTRTDDNSTRNLNLSGAYPITNRIHLFGGIDKSLDANVTNSETMGIAFEDCCWSARLVHFKEAFTNNIPIYDYSTGFELVFKGLGSSDSSLKSRIKANIPTYKVEMSETNNLLNDAE
jgi:LPS-assembly protein